MSIQYQPRAAASHTCPPGPTTLADGARRIEDAGFDSAWVFGALARGFQLSRSAAGRPYVGPEDHLAWTPGPEPPHSR